MFDSEHSANQQKCCAKQNIAWSNFYIKQLLKNVNFSKLANPKTSNKKYYLELNSYLIRLAHMLVGWMNLMQVESSILKGRYWPFEIANNIFDGVFEVAKVVGNIILRKTWITDISSEYSRGLYEICNDGGILLLLSHCKKMERCICLRWERQKMLWYENIFP
ncbi:hypothetical protein D917_05919 [Trichinella nativa]|uniref:Uncharacterized protein n=1 Tax=Trichinella nativa TaxID=6335 RepID=A0A1Y3EYL0_9BILA|nr:hypothetical protein D917_05919 [Trichinella nativa]